MFDDITHPLQIFRTRKVNYSGKLENSMILVAKHATELQESGKGQIFY